VASKRSIIDIDSLTVAERIQLAEDLWDSIPADSPELADPPWLDALLEERLAQLERDPDSGEPWEVVVEEVRARLRRRG
jgi:putative addiction module component (TIGR02574 family)